MFVGTAASWSSDVGSTVNSIGGVAPTAYGGLALLGSAHQLGAGGSPPQLDVQYSVPMTQGPSPPPGSPGTPPMHVKSGVGPVGHSLFTVGSGAVLPIGISALPVCTT